MVKHSLRLSAFALLGGILLFLNVSRITHASPNLVADYRFNNTNTSSVGSPPALVDIGTNSFAADTVDATSCNVLTFPSGNGLTLATNGVIASDSYSIVMLVRLDTVSSFRKLVDFTNGTSDDGLYDYSGELDLYPGNVGSNAVFQAGTYSQVVLTRDGTSDQVTGYVDGVQQIQFTDSSNYAVVDASNTMRFVIDDESTKSEESGGAIARLRLYDGVLSSGEVASLDRTHPDCGGPSVITLQNTNSALNYNGWEGVLDGGASGGSYRQSKTAGGDMTAKIKGTSIQYFYYAGPNMGKVDVYIDSVKVKSLCEHSAAPAYMSKTFKNLANTKHTFELRVLNKSCGGSTDKFVSVDKLVAGANTQEDTNLKWNWNGWAGKTNATANGGNYHSSKTAGAFAKLTFHGTSISVLTLKGPSFGKLDVLIDSSPIETLDLSNGSVVAFARSYNSLADADHTIELRRNASSGTKAVVVDGLRGPVTLP